MKISERSEWAIEGELKVGDRLIFRPGGSDRERDCEVVEIDRGTFKIHSGTHDYWLSDISLLSCYMRDLRKPPPIMAVAPSPMGSVVDSRDDRPASHATAFSADKKPEPYRPMF